MKTIEQLWQGNIDPIANFGGGHDEVHLLETEICKSFDDLGESYNEEKILKLREKLNHYARVLQKKSFCDGFSLGCKITSEAFVNAEGLINK